MRESIFLLAYWMTKGLTGSFIALFFAVIWGISEICAFTLYFTARPIYSEVDWTGGIEWMLCVCFPSCPKDVILHIPTRSTPLPLDFTLRLPLASLVTHSNVHVLWLASAVWP